MLFRLALMIALVVFAVGIAAPLSADLALGPVSDPQEHSAMKKLADAERILEHHKMELAAQKAVALLAERPEWERAPWTELVYAEARFGSGPEAYEESLAACRRIFETYKVSQPFLASRAMQSYANNVRLRQLQAYWEIESLIPGLQNFYWVLRARFVAGPLLAKLLSSPRFTKDDTELGVKLKERLGLDAPEQDVEAWALAIISAHHARTGETERAYAEYDRLRGLMPADDRRLALAGVGLALGEMNLACKEKDEALLLHAEEFALGLEQDFPEEVWLKARWRLGVVEQILRFRTRLPDAEQYLHEVIAAPETDLSPQAYSWLSEIVYHQKRYDEAAAVAQDAVGRYPYSTWMDFTTYHWANCLRRAGREAEASVVLSRLDNLFPDSSWVGAGKVMTKEMAE